MNSEPGNGQDTTAEPFEDERPPYAAPHQYDLLLDLEGFEGPIDLLLTLAREQKVDLTRISILQLANQYLEFIAQARELRLEVAADYLVMAAWLAYLKSRLLLPDAAEGEEPSASELAARLAFQLQRLEAMREAAMKLMNRPQLGRDFFARGEPERIPVVQTNVFDVSLYDLLTVYGAYSHRQSATTLRIDPSELYSMDDALRRLNSLVGDLPDWVTLLSFLPPGIRAGMMARSALATTFAATLELARTGKIQLRQTGMFGPIYIKGTGGHA